MFAEKKPGEAILVLGLRISEAVDLMDGLVQIYVRKMPNGTLKIYCKAPVEVPIKRVKLSANA